MHDMILGAAARDDALGVERLGGLEAIRRAAANPNRRWNASLASAERSASPDDASMRIFDGFADVKAAYDGPPLRLDDGVYAIGSCFAREIEQHLFHLGGRVLSLSHEVTDRPAFRDGAGRSRNTYFHRYTPQSLAQDMARAFGVLRGWRDDESLIWRLGRNTFDFDLGWVAGADMSREAVLARRAGARQLSAGLKDAACVVLTLGLIEAWRHRPSGLWCNRAHPSVVKAAPEDFELCISSYEQVSACLEDCLRLLRAYGRPGVQLVVTVSPVPLQESFAAGDIVVANAESKAVLRAAAGAFVRRHPDAHYFPSYEMVTLSDPQRAWRPDRVHVEGQLVREIVRGFTRLYYAPGEMKKAAKARAGLSAAAETPA